MGRRIADVNCHLTRYEPAEMTEDYGSAATVSAPLFLGRVPAHIADVTKRRQSIGGAHSIIIVRGLTLPGDLVPGFAPAEGDIATCEALDGSTFTVTVASTTRVLGRGTREALIIVGAVDT